MSKRLPALLGLGAMAVLAGGGAWAGTPRTGDTSDAPATAAVARAHQELAQHHAELDRLQQEVARQEAESRQAQARQGEQDRVIAELQRQLQALQDDKDAPAQRH